MIWGFVIAFKFMHTHTLGLILVFGYGYLRFFGSFCSFCRLIILLYFFLSLHMCVCVRLQLLFDSLLILYNKNLGRPSLQLPFLICSCLGMHLFGGKFCTRTDGSQRACTCPEVLRSRTNRMRLIDSSYTSRHLQQITKNTDCVCARKNFDYFLAALVTVFQVY